MESRIASETVGVAPTTRDETRSASGGSDAMPHVRPPSPPTRAFRARRRLEPRRSAEDARAAARIVAGKYAALKEKHAQHRKAALAREETFEDELRKAAERCAEVEAGRRSARAALAEMASQNARLVSAFSAKKEEARTLREEVDEARRAKASTASGAEDATRAAREQARALREELKRSAAEHAETRAELAEAKLEIERLRDAVAAAVRREARGEGDAEAAGTRAREESLAARVARKELEVERAQFAAERARWESERKRWAGEIASVRAAAAAAAKSGGANADASSKPDAPPVWSERPHASGAAPNAAFKDPYKSGKGTGSRSQPSSPTRRAKGTALSPARAANAFPSSRAPGAGARGAPRARAVGALLADAHRTRVRVRGSLTRPRRESPEPR